VVHGLACTSLARGHNVTVIMPFYECYAPPHFTQLPPPACQLHKRCRTNLVTPPLLAPLTPPPICPPLPPPSHPQTNFAQCRWEV
jgi:hypothetical protein